MQIAYPFPAFSAVYRENDLPLLGKFHSVSQQVVQDLSYPQGVTDKKARDLIGAVKAEGYALFCGQGGVGMGQGIKQITVQRRAAW